MEKPKKPLWADEYERTKSSITSLENQIDRMKKELEDEIKEFDKKFKDLESTYQTYEADLRKWERTATFKGDEYVEYGGFLRSEENLYYMLKNYHWDARKKSLIANIEFDAYHEGLEKGVSVEKLEDIVEPLVTNISKEFFPDEKTNRFYKIAYMSDGNIIGYQLIDLSTLIYLGDYIYSKKLKKPNN